MQKHFFLNGVGLGLDGRVVYEVNETKGKKINVTTLEKR